MKLNINTKKVASVLIAGGIALNSTILDVKAPTTEDIITMIITDDLNEIDKNDVIHDIEEANTNKLTFVIKPVYDVKMVPIYDDIVIDGKTKKVMIGIKEEKFVSKFVKEYVDSTYEEYNEEKYHSSKVKQR